MSMHIQWLLDAFGSGADTVGVKNGFAHVRDDCGGDRTWFRWQHVFGDVLII